MDDHYECPHCEEVFERLEDYEDHGIRCWYLYPREYGYKPSPRFVGEGSLHYGVELEIEVPVGMSPDSPKLQEAYKHLLGLIYLKTDGSLRHGVEIVSHPMTREAWYARRGDLVRMCTVLSNVECRSHDTTTCGLHIHASRKAAHLSTWARVSVAWHTWESQIQEICRRAYNSYCCRKNLDGMTIQEKERAATRSYSGRYDAVNFQPRHTVEFRQFRGTLRAETILASILFVDELLHFCRRHTTEEIVAEDGWKKFMRSVNKSNRAGIEILKDYLQERLDVHYLHS